MFWDEDFANGQPRIAQTAAYLRVWLDQARPDWSTRQAAALPVLALPVAATPKGGAAHLNSAPWTPRLEAYAVAVSKVTATVSANGPGYVQLSHAWFPGNQVRVNGKVVQPLEGALHLVIVPIGSGISHIEIVPIQTPVRRLAAAISLAALLVTILIALAGGFRRRRQGRLPAAEPGVA